jgi:hypothetical protein
MKKSCGQRQLPTTKTTKPPRNQAFKRLVIPYKVKEGSKQGRGSKGKKHQKHLKSIPSLERINHRA